MNKKEIYRILSEIHERWSFLIRESYRLKDDKFRSETLKFARLMIAPAKKATENIIEDLIKQGYRFAHQDRIFISSEPDVWEWLREIEDRGIFFPISLQAWFGEIGSVNIMGDHPDCPGEACVFDTNSKGGDLWLTDPLVIDFDKESVIYEHEVWRDSINSYGFDTIGPFNLPIAPDHFHKAQVGGGLPYEVAAYKPCVDSLVFNERHCTSFVNYLRICFLWVRKLGKNIDGKI